MPGKQWVNHYLKNRGGSAADKSQDRQRKSDGLDRWHFHLLIIQLVLLLPGCALSQYLWTISHTVAGFILAFTLLTPSLLSQPYLLRLPLPNTFCPH